MATGEGRRNRLRIRLRPVPIMQFVRRIHSPAPVKDPGNDPRHRSSRVLRLVRHLPVVVVNSPERVVLNFAFILIGIAAFIPNQPGSVLDYWPSWIMIAWGLMMFVGGGAVLCGMFRNLTSVERLGYVLVAPACFGFAVAVLYVRGVVALPVFLIFLGLAVAKVIRMVISSAERDMTIEYGARLDRELKDIADSDES